jgi:hypothetical protein
MLLEETHLGLIADACLLLTLLAPEAAKGWSSPRRLKMSDLSQKINQSFTMTA